MSEETQNTEVVETTSEVPQYTDIEQKALDMGWRPKDEFSGSEEEFIDAKEFVRRKPLFDRIEQQSKDLKAIKRAMEAFKEHNARVEEVAVQKAIQQLKAGRKEALSSGDGDQFDLYDEEIKAAEAQLTSIKKLKETPIVENTELPPEFQQWVDKNSWYNSTKYMREFADEVGQRLAATGLTPAEVLKKVEESVRKEFPQKFSNPNKQQAPSVTTGSKPSGLKASADEAKLNDFQKKVMGDLVRQGVLTKEKYIAQLKEIGAI